MARPAAIGLCLPKDGQTETGGAQKKGAAEGNKPQQDDAKKQHRHGHPLCLLRMLRKHAGGRCARPGCSDKVSVGNSKAVHSTYDGGLDRHTVISHAKLPGSSNAYVWMRNQGLEQRRHHS
jgi:hypothetical protein